ncbi:MAG TPA: UDP-3-O-(3-hydroxymyristoyl)glucosamine N-acyltransferase [Pyrinomonadaceae bacterium]
MSRETKEMTASELAAHVGGRVAGDGSVLIRGIASLEEAGEGEIAFVEDAKLLESARSSRASCLIVPEGAQLSGACMIEVKRPKLAFALISELLHPPKRRAPQIHPTAIVAASAQLHETVFVGAHVEIGEGASIGAGTELHAGAVIGDGVTVGQDCVIHPNVVLYDGVSLGNRVILHAGVIVGADGFGYVPDEKNIRHKFPQIGTVVIEDDVEIGACTCIDRAALGRTRIGRATKIDNLVQIAHNVEIGERVVIAAQTGISGSTVIEDDAVIGGQVGMGDHARVERGAIIGSKAGVLPGKIVRAGVWWGIPVQPLDQYKRLNAHMNRLPQMRAELKELRKQLKELQEKIEKE